MTVIMMIMMLVKVMIMMMKRNDDYGDNKIGMKLIIDMFFFKNDNDDN